LRAASALLAFLLAGCSPMEKAQRLERDGKPAEAAEAYSAAAKARPGSPDAPKALLAAGRLWSRLGRCDRAEPAFEDAAKLYGEPWRAQAEAELLDCPDFFPLKAGSSWMLGDSETGGSNMRQEFKTVSAALDGAGELEVKIYAGRKLYTTIKRKIKKAEWRIEESDKSGVSTVVLRYPFKAGSTWTSRRGQKEVRFTIDSSSETVEVKAGRFSGCLKVREQIEGLPSWTYTYYAPGIGRVLTSVAGRGYETRNAELLSPPKS
jgi:tetratricopeptide (TPR) repeat protein